MRLLCLPQTFEFKIGLVLGLGLRLGLEITYDEAVVKQALRNSCELLRQRKELHTNSWNCMQAYVIACKLM